MSRPNVLDLATNLDLESERKYAAQSNKTVRVKIERGHAWLIRFLPFPQGPGREIFARLAQHWIGGRTVSCKTETSPNFGGDPSYVCPVCETAAACKNEARSDDEANDFYQVEARPQYRCYCLVFKKENDRGKVEEMSDEEMLIPHEFNIPKSSFPALVAKIDRSKTRRDASPLGLLDLETGSDLWAIRDAKNSLNFDLADDGPIFTLDDLFEEKLAKVWKQLRQPSVKFLDDDRMAALADMVAERAFERAAKSLSERRDDGGGRGRSGGSRGRFHESDDGGGRGRGQSREDDGGGRGRGRGDDGGAGDQPAPARSTRSVAGGRATGFTRAQAALNDGDEDQVPGAEIPARGRGRAASIAEEAPQTGGEQEAGDTPPEEAPPVSPRRGGSALRPAAAAAPAPAAVSAGRRAGAPVPAPARAEGGRVEDEEPGQGDPPEENSDPVPAAPAATAPVERSASRTPARSALQGSLRSSVANLASRGR